MTERARPPFAADERTTLNAYLDFQRATSLMKVEGVTDEQARWSPVPSGTSLLGLVRHLTYVERWWFAYLLGGIDDHVPWLADDGDDGFRVPPETTLTDVVAAYETECARSRAVFASVSLDHLTREPAPGRSARRVAVHMVEETARHVGHADLIRELVDGQVGE
ncbi:MAG TPA: DinB family protein [Frankiaceae bacterium]|nr:DinB family protein [Frankiaceae bacterium]